MRSIMWVRNWIRNAYDRFDFTVVEWMVWLALLVYLSGALWAYVQWHYVGR